MLLLNFINNLHSTLIKYKEEKIVLLVWGVKDLHSTLIKYKAAINRVLFIL